VGCHTAHECYAEGSVPILVDESVYLLTLENLRGVNRPSSLVLSLWVLVTEKSAVRLTI